MKVGKAKYSTGKNTFYVKKDEPLVCRILPGLGKLADAGTWRVYYSVQWGFKNSEGKLRPFLDPYKQNFKTKMIEVPSAARDLRDKLNNKKDELKKASKDNPDDTQILDQYNKYVALSKAYNIDNNNYMNIVTIDNKIGLLKVGTKFKNALIAEIEKQLKNGIDPLDPENGMYFTFFKTNPSPTNAIQDWVHSVTPYKENVQAIVNGQTVTVEQQKFHSMDDAFCNRLSAEAYELSGMFLAPTSEEVARIVTEGSKAVDEILGVEQSASNSTTATTQELAAPVAASTTTSPTAADLISEGVLSNMDSLPTPPVETSTPAPVATAPALSDDDFLASLSVKS